MLRLSIRRLARRKHGQRAWSPNASSAGAAPSNGVTAREALQIAYRPMPPEHTVEYEEDFGPSMIIHREFISRRGRDSMSFHMSPLAYSELELRRARRQLSDNMNRERAGVLIGPGGEEADRAPLMTDVEGESREIRSERFLFNEQRMQYCDRFQGFFRGLLERTGADVGADDAQVLFSLMEACAVIYGCETQLAREAHYARFLGLDVDTLRDAEESLRERQRDVRLLAAKLRGPHPSADSAQKLIESLPSLLSGDEGEEEGGASAALDTSQSADASSSTTSSAGPQQSATPEESNAGADDAVVLDQLEGFAPLLRSYAEHAAGESPTVSYDVETTGAAELLATRRRWRSLMDALVEERWEELTASDLAAAAELNSQLHTVKFFDLKVGDTVRELVQLAHRESGDGSSLHRDAPLQVSPTHPERRV